MTEREICGSCRGPWPCTCSPQAVVVVLREADDDVSERLARGMARSSDPLIAKPYEPPIRDVTWLTPDPHCGHYTKGFDIDTDKRIVSCRGCHTPLDPYDVLQKLASLDRRTDERLAALRQLERQAQQREAERKARAALRRHPYQPYWYKDDARERCLVCSGDSGGDIHDAKPRRTSRRGA